MLILDVLVNRVDHMFYALLRNIRIIDLVHYVPLDLLSDHFIFKLVMFHFIDYIR